MSNDLKDFADTVSSPKKIFMSYSRIGYLCKLKLNFSTIKVISSGKSKYYNQGQNVMLAGKIIDALVGDQPIKNKKCSIIFPRKSFRNSLEVYGLDGEEIRKLKKVKLHIVKINKKRYDIKLLEE